MTAAQDHPYGFSPGSASAEFDDHLDPLAFDEDELAFGGEDEASFNDQDDVSEVGTTSRTGKSKKSSDRKGPHNVEKRSVHNATERARRDNLNTRFMTLAGALPTMKNIKRPSKAVIITKALDFVYDSQVREHTLVTENNDLRREVDQLRARLGMEPLPPPAPLPEPKMATQSTMRKTKKQQAARARAAAASTSVEAEVTPKVESPVPAFQPATPHSTASPQSYIAGVVSHPSPNESVASSVQRSASGIFDSAPSPQIVAPQPPTFPPHTTFFSASPPSTSASLDALSSSPVVEAPIAHQQQQHAYPPPPPFYPPASLPPTPTHTLAYHAMLAPQQHQAAHAAALYQAQQLAGFLAANPSNAASPAGLNAAAALMNPQLLFALQQQQQQQHALGLPASAGFLPQAMPQQDWMPTPPGSCGSGAVAGGGIGMFASPLDGLGF
ncbi:hypothetical protein JCM11251_005019 [Rhodosporidiobolus azoricus]